MDMVFDKGFPLFHQHYLEYAIKNKALYKL